MDIGGVYNHLFTSSEKDEYLKILDKVKAECHDKNILLLANTGDVSYKKKNKDSYVIKSVYTYLSPDIKKAYGSDVFKNSIKDYKRLTGWYKDLWKGIFGVAKDNSHADDFLKYDIQ